MDTTAVEWWGRGVNLGVIDTRATAVVKSVMAVNSVQQQYFKVLKVQTPRQLLSSGV